MQSADRSIPENLCNKCRDWRTIIKGTVEFPCPDCRTEEYEVWCAARMTGRQGKIPDRAYLIAITDPAEVWIRRCNNRVPGSRVERVTLRVVLASSTDVHVDHRGWIVWRAAGKEFSAEPVSPAADSPALPA